MFENIKNDYENSLNEKMKEYTRDVKIINEWLDKAVRENADLIIFMEYELIGMAATSFPVSYYSIDSNEVYLLDKNGHEIEFLCNPIITDMENNTFEVISKGGITLEIMVCI